MLALPFVLLATALDPTRTWAQQKIIIAAPAAIQPQVRQQIERNIFRAYPSAADARRGLDTQLLEQVEEIDRACKLTDAQKQKLNLAGRGDLKRFFDRYEAFQRQLQFQDTDNFNGLVLPQEAVVLGNMLLSGLFHEDSLLHKSVRHTLTADQIDRYDALIRERREKRHRASIESAVEMLERGWRMTDVQRRGLIALLAKETKPARRPSTYDGYRILFQFSRLPQEKQRSLFKDEGQWAVLNQQLTQSLQVVPRLRQLGVWPADEDEDDAADA